MQTPLYSIRMRASRAGEHISGAERIVPFGDLPALCAELTCRAQEHPRGIPDEIRLSIDAIDPATVRHGSLPDITTVRVDDLAAGREAALAELIKAGVSESAAVAAMQLLTNGPNPDGGGLRGALLVESRNGVRLEPDPRRGVRVSRMDLEPSAAERLQRVLAARRLDNPHVREALVLAAKVRMVPGFVAELCWSDDPDYTAGYVSTLHRGYVRFPHLKSLGDSHGGRAFFLRTDDLDLAAVIAFLQRTPVLFDRVGTIHPDEEYRP